MPVDIDPYLKAKGSEKGFYYDGGLKAKFYSEGSNFFGFGHAGKNNGGFNGGLGFGVEF